MKEHFEQFCKEKMYLKSVAKETLNFYRDSFRAWERDMGDAQFTKQSLKLFVIALQERGLSVASINCYSRGINSFLSWLHENEYLTERLKIVPLREELKLMPTYQPVHLKTFVSFKGKKWTEKRIHAILCVLIDTGCRISEVLNIRREDVDFDNLLITVTGKGKQRKVPLYEKSLSPES